MTMLMAACLILAMGCGVVVVRCDSEEKFISLGSTYSKLLTGSSYQIKQYICIHVDQIDHGEFESVCM
jgi:hypothetical protein